MTTMKSTQQVSGKLTGVVDRLGKPAKLSDVTVASSDETVVVATYDAASGAIVVKGVAEGEATVVLTGDASVDAGLQGFEASEDFTIQSGDVVAGSLTFDAPVEQ
jgi:hypothetical protein